MLKIDASNLKSIDFEDVGNVPVGKWLAAVGPGEVPISVGVVSLPPRTILANVFMGVQLANSRDPGARVQVVVPGGNAARAGMQVDDLIVAINDEPVIDQKSVTARLSKLLPGTKVNVRVQRGDEQLDLAVTLAARGQGSLRSQRQNTMGGKVSKRASGFPLVIQHDMVNLNPSECGSPVISIDGTIIGLNIARAGRTETYALPASVVRELIEELKAGKYPPTNTQTAVAPHRERPTTGPTSSR
jgi:serine protease Do